MATLQSPDFFKKTKQIYIITITSYWRTSLCHMNLTTSKDWYLTFHFWKSYFPKSPRDRDFPALVPQMGNTLPTLICLVPSPLSLRGQVFGFQETLLSVLCHLWPHFLCFKLLIDLPSWNCFIVPFRLLLSRSVTWEIIIRAEIPQAPHPLHFESTTLLNAIRLDTYLWATKYGDYQDLHIH